MAGNEADDLELVLRGRYVAAAGRAGKRGDYVGNGYGIRCRKADVAAHGIGAKGVLHDKRLHLSINSAF